MESAAPGEAARELNSDTDTRSHESVSSKSLLFSVAGFPKGLASGARRSRSSALSMARVKARQNCGRARARVSRGARAPRLRQRFPRNG